MCFSIFNDDDDDATDINMSIKLKLMPTTLARIKKRQSTTTHYFLFVFQCLILMFGLKHVHRALHCGRIVRVDSAFTNGRCLVDTPFSC